MDSEWFISICNGIRIIMVHTVNKEFQLNFGIYLFAIVQYISIKNAILPMSQLLSSLFSDSSDSLFPTIWLVRALANFALRSLFLLCLRFIPSLLALGFLRVLDCVVPLEFGHSDDLWCPHALQGPSVDVPHHQTSFLCIFGSRIFS